MDLPNQRTTRPIVTGTSVLACKYAGGVAILADTLGSYGSLARFKDLKRIRQVNEQTLIGGGGEYSDLQFISRHLEEMATVDFTESDGGEKSPREVYNFLSRLLYSRRSKVNPLYNQLVIAGVNRAAPSGGAPAAAGAVAAPFLGYVDLYGSHFEADVVGTGFGQYLALPLLRKHWRPDLTEAQAKELLESSMRVLFYRDTRTINKFQFARISSEGATVSEPYALSTEWSHKRFVDPYAQ